MWGIYANPDIIGLQNSEWRRKAGRRGKPNKLQFLHSTCTFAKCFSIMSTYIYTTVSQNCNLHVVYCKKKLKSIFIVIVKVDIFKNPNIQIPRLEPNMTGKKTQ